jgi:hypothetical protein
MQDEFESTEEAAGDDGQQDLLLTPRAEIWALFAISGKDLNPDYLTHDLGMEPDRIVHADPTQDTHGVWQINSSLGVYEPFERHAMEILERLIPVRRQLRDLSRGARLEFYAVIQKKTHDTSLFEIPPRLLLFMGYIGANLALEVTD